MSLSGENYHYFSSGEGDRIKVLVEIAKELSVEDFKFWRERIIDFLNNIEHKQDLLGAKSLHSKHMEGKK